MLNPTQGRDAEGLTLRVAEKRPAGQDVCHLVLVAPDGAALPAFTAGAHVELQLPGGRVRSYSLCNAPGNIQQYELGVLRAADSRGGSAAVHDLVQVGDLIRVSQPRNLFELDPTAPHSLLLAGGIGITPLMAMAEALHAAGQSFELHVACRSQARQPFAARLAQSAWAEQVVVHLDDQGEAQRLHLPSLLARQPPDSHLYVCGPDGFMAAVLNEGRQQGWVESRLHREYFGAAPVAVEGEQPFDVRLARSGLVIRVQADQTMVQALSDAGVEVMTSCGQGVCGTCLTPVLEGVPDHRDQYLTPEEQAAGDQCLPCCSRSLTPLLVLDL